MKIIRVCLNILGLVFLASSGPVFSLFPRWHGYWPIGWLYGDTRMFFGYLLIGLALLAFRAARASTATLSRWHDEMKG